jgi:hypothetical protein
MPTRRSCVGGGAVAGLIALGAAIVAAPGDASSNAPRRAPKPPPGYVFVLVAYDIPANVQSRVTATCPAGTVPLGGGIQIPVGGGFDMDVNGSFPTATGWAADVNNRTVDAIHVEVQASCATMPASYQLVSASFANPAGSQTTGSVDCPAGTDAYGGGAKTNTRTLRVSINSTVATGGLEPRGWQVVMNNNGNRASTTQVYAVCGHERRAAFSPTSAETTVPPGESAQAFVFCPRKFVVTGGGASTTASRDVSLQQIIPARQGPFVVAARNTGSTPATVTAQAVCGRT